MLVISVKQRAHAVIPELDDTIMQTGEDPRAFGVEGKSLHAVGFRLKLSQHPQALQSKKKEITK